MRLSELRDKKVKTLDGETLGRVHEVNCDKGAITALSCGPGSLLERLTAREHGRKIAWECVRRIDRDAIVISTEPAKREASGSRSRQRTRRPSARRSKR